MGKKLVDLNASIDSFFEREVDKISSDSGRAKLFSFSGAIEEEMVYEIGVNIETYLKEIGVKKSTIRRVFFLFTESIQNIRNHGLKNPDGSVSGAYIIESKGDGFLMSFYSATLKKYLDPLFSVIDHINSLSNDQLKTHYRAILSNGEMTDKGGAGLGLIMLGMKCTGPLGYDSMEFEENVCVVKISFDLSEA